MTQDRFVLNSPYDGIDGLQALKGMWHSHLAQDEFGPDRVRDICRQGGHDFLGITDHDNRYPRLPWSEGDWRRVSGDGFLVIRGFEATHPIGHITCLGLEPAQAGIDAEAARRNRDERAGLDAGYEGFLERASRGGAFLALNHPHRWRGEAGALMSQPGFRHIHALEIYNGNQAGKAHAQGYTMDLLDECLSAGGRLWAAANPDCHSWDVTLADGPFNGYSVVFAAELTRAAILEGLKAGRFYASTGLELTGLRVAGDRLEVAAAACERVSFYGAGGQLLEQVRGEQATYRFRGTEGYVRAELRAATGDTPGGSGFPRMAWLQPIWVNPA